MARRGDKIPWVWESKYHGYGGQITMDRGFDISWVGGQNTMGRGG